MGLFKKNKNQSEFLERIPLQEQKKPEKSLPGRFWQEKPWLSRGLVVSLACGMVFSGFYGIFRARADKYQESPTDSTESIGWLYQSCYLLYRDLYNSRQKETAGYRDIYLEGDEGYQWISDDKKRDDYLFLLDLVEESAMEENADNGSRTETWQEDAGEAESLDEETLRAYADSMGVAVREWPEEYVDSMLACNLTRDECYSLESEMERFDSYFQSIESSFRELNLCYDYLIVDNATGKFLTNMSEEDRNLDPALQQFLISFRFDSAGNATVGDIVRGGDESTVRKAGNEVIRDNLAKSMLGSAMKVFCQYGGIRGPADCTVTFSIRAEDWKERKNYFHAGTVDNNEMGLYFYNCRRSWGNDTSAYLDSGLGGILILGMLFLALLGCFLPVMGKTKPWKDVGLQQVG